MKTLFNKAFLTAVLSIFFINSMEAVFVQGKPSDFKAATDVYLSMHSEVYKSFIPDENARVSYMVARMLEVFMEAFMKQSEFAVMKKNVESDDASVSEHIGQVSFKVEGSKIWLLEASYKPEVDVKTFNAEFLEYLHTNYPDVKVLYGPGMNGDAPVFKYYRDRLEGLGFVRIDDEEENAEAIKYVNDTRKPLAFGYKLIISE